MSDIVLKSESELAGMRAAGRLAAESLAFALGLVAPGVTTEAIDAATDAFIRSRGAVPAPLHYGGTDERPPYPKSICTSVNEVICHGIPGPAPLREGDVVCVDVTVILEGWHGDTASTVPVGRADDRARRLMRATLECLRRGVAAARGGRSLVAIGEAIQPFAEGLGYGVVEDLIGHGIGRRFHEEPQVSHFARPRGLRRRPSGPLLRRGMTFTVEPMINEGTWKAALLDDGWTVVTTDGKLSAQYEHTIAIRGDGEEPEVLTLLPGAKTDAPGGFEP
jgi:methionyl aminopeptidase